MYMRGNATTATRVTLATCHICRCVVHFRVHIKKTKTWGWVPSCYFFPKLHLSQRVV